MLAQTDTSASPKTYALTVLVDGEAVTWQSPEADDALLSSDDAIVKVTFAGGGLTLNLADWNRFDYAHVLGVSIRETGENLYTISATVRHHDQGWDNYADAFEVMGDKVANGLRVLTHPHDTEQPFTRSQSGVSASGLVTVAAKDNVEGWGGSSISIDLEQFAGSTVSFSLEPLE